MTRTILILTEPGDIHAYVVAEALRLKGGMPIIWHTADFPSIATESILFQGQKRTTRLAIPGTPLLDLETIDPSSLTIWNRRPAFAVDATVLHPADVAFAEMECTIFRRSLFSVLARDAFWVNPPDLAVRASRKLVQHQAALDLGLTVPDTLYSNDPEGIRAFIRTHGGTIIYKPFRGLPWRTSETSWVPYTSLLSEEALVPDETLRNAPGIYQELVPKQFELRITVMGSHSLAAKVLSQETVDGKVDWRKAYAELQMQPFELPMEVHDLCCALLRRLGIVFGCFDFIVTPDGDFVFLEVNEMGQFLFVETSAGIPLVDTFSEFLMQGRVNFRQNRSKAKIRYADVLSKVESEAIASKQAHVKPPDQSFQENQ